jgi:hypothetical protein
MPAGYRSLLIGQQADGTAVTGTAEGSLLIGQAKLTLPANFIDQIGKRFAVTAHGRISNIVTTPGTLTLRLKFGSIIVATTAALQLNAVAKTNVFWWMEWMLVARAIGSGTTANFMHNGAFLSESVVGSPLPASGGAGELAVQPSAPAVGTGFDSTVANVIDFAAIFSLTGNSILCHDYALESLN